MSEIAELVGQATNMDVLNTLTVDQLKNIAMSVTRTLHKKYLEEGAEGSSPCGEKKRRRRTHRGKGAAKAESEADSPGGAAAAAAAAAAASGSGSGMTADMNDPFGKWGPFGPFGFRSFGVPYEQQHPEHFQGHEHRPPAPWRRRHGHHPSWFRHHHHHPPPPPPPHFFRGCHPPPGPPPGPPPPFGYDDYDPAFENYTQYGPEQYDHVYQQHYPHMPQHNARPHRHAPVPPPPPPQSNSAGSPRGTDSARGPPPIPTNSYPFRWFEDVFDYERYVGEIVDTSSSESSNDDENIMKDVEII